MRRNRSRKGGGEKILAVDNVLERVLLAIGLNFCLVFSASTYSEIYRSVDSQGRVYFSDRPMQQYDRAGYSHSSSDLTPDVSSSARSSKDLNEIAKKLRADRLERKKIRDKESKIKNAKDKNQKKKIAAAKRKKRACKKAREKEDIAFRKRTQRQSLVNMRKALDNYNKKREIRRVKCND